MKSNDNNHGKPQSNNQTYSGQKQQQPQQQQQGQKSGDNKGSPRPMDNKGNQHAAQPGSKNSGTQYSGKPGDHSKH